MEICKGDLANYRDVIMRPLMKRAVVINLMKWCWKSRLSRLHFTNPGCDAKSHESERNHYRLDKYPPYGEKTTHAEQVGTENPDPHSAPSGI